MLMEKVRQYGTRSPTTTELPAVRPVMLLVTVITRLLLVTMYCYIKILVFNFKKNL